MNELIVINYSKENPTVSARDLHKSLEVATEFRHWFPRMCEYGFGDKDYTPVFFDHPQNGQPTADYAMTIPMAKELCMIQRNEKGKQMRQYFIAVEEAWNSPEKIMERALHIAHQRAEEAERRIFALAEKNETLEIALNDSLKFYTVAKYNNVYRQHWDMKRCQDIGKKLSAYCRANSIHIGKCETNDERFGDVHSYPLTAWESFLNRYATV